MFVTAYNPTDGPVLIDDAGRVLGGGEFGPVDTTEQPTKDALEDGRLVRPDSEPGRGASDEAIAAAQRAKLLEERAQAFRALDKPVLIRLAGDVDVAPGLDDDQLPAKAALVSALAYSDVPVPPKKES